MNNCYQKKDNQPYIGIIKLDTKFQRLLGDIGNPNTWNFPVVYQVIEGIYPENIVNHDDYRVLISAIKAARYLEEKGVDAITTTCGFMAKYQKDISNSVNVPVFTSSLLQIPMIYQILNKKKRIGVITANSKSLTEEHLYGAGIQNSPLIIMGMENREYFQKIFIQNQPGFINKERIIKEIIETVKNMLNFNKDIGAIVLECTNMSPYAYDIQKISNLPVFDIYTLMQWFYSGLIKSFFN